MNTKPAPKKISKTLSKLLGNRKEYQKVPFGKLEEAKFFLDQMKSAKKRYYNPVGTTGYKRINGADINNRLLYDVANYADAFIYSILGFFDTLAIVHTSNRKARLTDINFSSFLAAISDKDDTYVNYLKNEDARWISKLRKNRNHFAHHILLSSLIKNWYPLIKKGEGVRTEFVVDLYGGKKPLISYCDTVYKRVEKMRRTINKNISKEWILEGGDQKTLFCVNQAYSQYLKAGSVDPNLISVFKKGDCKPTAP